MYVNIQKSYMNFFSLFLCSGKPYVSNLSYSDPIFLNLILLKCIIFDS